MKLTKTKLKQIIKEEVGRVLKEYYDESDSQVSAERGEERKAHQETMTKEEKLLSVLLDEMPELKDQMPDDKLRRLVSTILNHSGLDPFVEKNLGSIEDHGTGEGLIDMAYTLAWLTSDHSPDSWKTQLEIYF